MSYPASLASRAATDESGGGGGNDAVEEEQDDDDEEDSPVGVAPAAPARAAITAMADVSRRCPEAAPGAVLSHMVCRSAPPMQWPEGCTCRCSQQQHRLPMACHPEPGPATWQPAWRRLLTKHHADPRCLASLQL